MAFGDFSWDLGYEYALVFFTCVGDVLLHDEVRSLDNFGCHASSALLFERSFGHFSECGPCVV